MTLTTIARYVLVAVIAAALAIQIGVVEANAEHIPIQDNEVPGERIGDELIMYPTNLDGCVVVDMAQEAADNGGELSDGDIALRDELMDEYNFFSLAGDENEYLYSERCQVYPEFVNSLPDEARFDFYSKFDLPPAPDGFAWAEDLTLVQSTYWD